MTTNEEYLHKQAVMDTLDIIGGKWKFPLIYCLCNGRKRFSEIEKTLSTITPTALSNTIKDLETHHIIKKTTDSSSKLVYYELTAYSQELKPIFLQLQTFGLKHRTNIISNLFNIPIIHKT